MELVNKALPAIENKKYSLCIFLDYKACFDTICRSSLLKKLCRYGVRGPSLELIKSYFENRKQMVVFKSDKSDVLSQNLGVVQGSKCGPLLFDIYSSEFSIVCGEDEHILYADDTCIVCVADTLETLTEVVNQKMRLISEWCNFNKICVEASKSKYMLITNRLIINNIQVKLSDVLLEEVTTFKYLGMMIDNKLKFQDQIDLVNVKLSRFCGITYRLSKRLNLSTAKNLYFACVHSTLIYCLVVWGGTCISTHRCDRTLRLQKRIVKNLFSRYFPASECLFKSTNILKLSDLYRLLVSVYMYKMLNRNMFTNLKSSLQLTERSHGYDTRFNSAYLTPFVRVETTRLNYKYNFVDIWNNIPMHIKSKPSVRVFKKSVASWLIDSY